MFWSCFRRLGGNQLCFRSFATLCSLFVSSLFLFIYLFVLFLWELFFMDSFCYCVFCSRALDVSTMLPVTVSCWCHSYLYLPQWVMWPVLSVFCQQAAHTTYQLSSPTCSTRVIQKSLTLKCVYCRSAVWRPCDVTPHAAHQNKSVVCSGSRVTNSTVMKLGGSVNRGGIIVKTYKEHLLTLI